MKFFKLKRGEDDIFFDDMESETGNWIAEIPWENTTENPFSGDFSWSDSPDGNYQDDLYSNLTTIPIDLSGESGPIYLGFMIQYELEAFFDWLDIYFKAQKPSYWERTDEKMLTNLLMPCRIALMAIILILPIAGW